MGEVTNVEDINVENRKILTSKVIFFLNAIFVLFLNTIYIIFFEKISILLSLGHFRLCFAKNSKKILYILVKNNIITVFKNNTIFDVSIFLFSTLLSSTLVPCPNLQAYHCIENCIVENKFEILILKMFTIANYLLSFNLN